MSCHETVSFAKYPCSNCSKSHLMQAYKVFARKKSMCFHEAYFPFYNFNFCRVNGNAPRVSLHNPMFVKLVPFYSEGQCCKIWSMQHSGISAGFFSFSNRVRVALLLPERFQITNDTACIRSAAHLDAQVPSKAEEVIWDWASQKNPLDQMVSIKRGVKLPQMLRGGRRSADMAVGRRGDW